MTVVIPVSRRKPRSEKDRVRMMAVASLLMTCAGLIALWSFFSTEPATIDGTQHSVVTVDFAELVGKKPQTLSIDVGQKKYTMSHSVFERHYPEDTMVARLLRGGQFELWTLSDDETYVMGISGPGIEIPATDGIAEVNDSRATLPWFGGAGLSIGFITGTLALARRRRLLESREA